MGRIPFARNPPHHSPAYRCGNMFAVLRNPPSRSKLEILRKTTSTSITRCGKIRLNPPFTMPRQDHATTTKNLLPAQADPPE